MRGVLVSVVAIGTLASCGRLSFDARGDGGNRDGSSNPDGGAAACNAITRIADDFAIDRRASLWSGAFFDGTTSGQVTNHSLVLTAEANAAMSFAGFQTGQYYDLRGRRTSVELVQPVSGTAASNGIELGYSPGTYVQLEETGGTLLASQRLDGTYSVMQTIPYDRVAHRYLAFSERAGRLYWETSSDGVTFVTLFDEVAPFDVALVTVTLYAGTQTPDPAPGSATFQSFNGGVADGSPACKANTLVDTFDDGAIGHLWERSFADACCTDTEPGGQVVLASNGTAGYVSRRSSAGYDLRDTAISVRTSGPLANTPMYSALEAVIDPKNYVQIEMRQSGYLLNRVAAGVQMQNPSALVAGDDFLRLREASGQLFFEASSDRVTWRVLDQEPTPLDLSDVVIGLEAGNNGNASANSVAFDDLNVP